MVINFSKKYIIIFQYFLIFFFHNQKELSAAFDPNSSESVDKLYRQIKFETDKFVDLPIVYNKLK